MVKIHEATGVGRVNGHPIIMIPRHKEKTQICVAVKKKTGVSQSNSMEEDVNIYTENGTKSAGSTGITCE